jgi:Zn-dependent alcohol dehydrogenase
VYHGVGVSGFAERTIVVEGAVVRVDQDVPLDLACIVGCGIQTGVGAVLNVARVQPGDTVLLMGLGGVGLAAVQAARLAGAHQILVSDPDGDRREMAEALGATAQIDPNEVDVAERVRFATGGVGADHAFDLAGSASLVRTGLDAIRSGGAVTIVGGDPTGQPLTVEPTTELLVKQKTIRGCLLGNSYGPRDVIRIIDLWRAGRFDLDRLVTSRRPLVEINLGFDDSRNCRGIRTVIDLQS